MRYCPACHSVFPNEFRTCPKDQSALRAAAELQPGMVLRGKYEVQERLGAGGMAAVYRARHLAFDEVCAIKVVAGRLADDEDFLRRFRNEAVVARRFQHPNAVRVDDLDTTEDGRPFIVMEYVRGPNLREVVRKEGALGLRRALTLARQVASALAAAHDLGIVHRDIKPDNILLAGEGPAESAKVLDFGIAKVKEGFFGDGEAVATRTGAVVGTPQYISPEQALGRRGDELDGRADLYSLGVVLYEMVTGRLPFESDTAMGMILQHLQTPPPAPHEVRPDLGIPEELSAVLVRALDKDREKRFRTARDMIAAIDGVLALPLPERAAAAATPPPEPVPADIDRRETRVMPRTPSATGTSTPPGAASATRVQPATVHLPPLPGTPVTPPPRVTTPPPLPTVFTDPPRRRRRIPGWLKWVGAGIAAWAIFGPDGDDRPRRRASGPSPSPAIAGAPAEDPEARDTRIEEDVERALEGSERTKDEAIYVDVEGAVVALTGHVHERDAAIEAGRLAAAVDGVAAVSNEIQLRAPGDHRSTVPRSQAVPAVPSAGGVPAPMPVPLPMLDSALRMMAKELPVAQLVKAGQRQLEAGQPEKALETFTAALSLDPTNREASEGAREAGRQIQRKHGHPPSPPPRPPTPPPAERR